MSTSRASDDATSHGLNMVLIAGGFAPVQCLSSVCRKPAITDRLRRRRASQEMLAGECPSKPAPLISDAQLAGVERDVVVVLEGRTDARAAAVHSQLLARGEGPGYSNGPLS